MSILTIITPQQVEQWENEKKRLLEVIAASQQRVHAINQLLTGARMLEIKSPEAQAAPTAAPATKLDEIDPTNFMGTIAKIVNDSKTDLSKKELKTALVAAGVPEERVKSAYFYVALNRLYEHNRIMLYKDGSIGKAEKVA